MQPVVTLRVVRPSAVLLVAGLTFGTSASLRAQADIPGERTAQRQMTYSLSLGPSLFAGSEGNYPGLQAQGGISYKPRTSSLGARADLLIHRFDTRSLYPCLLQQADVCFQTSQRTVSGFSVGLTYEPPKRSASRAIPTPYLVGGLAVYESRRDARRQADCTIEGVCSAAQRETLRDTDFGANLGAGVTFMVANVDMFAEIRLHQPVWHTGPERPLRNFRLIPMSIGVRF